MVVGVSVVLVALALAYWAMRPDAGFIAGILPLSDDEALVLVRANYGEGPSRWWLLRVGADGRRVWTSDLSGPPAASGAGHGIATDGSIVIASVEGHDDTRLVALEASSGRLLWERAFGGRATTQPILHAHEVVVSFEGHAGSQLLGLSLADGHVRWTHAPSEEVYDPIVDESATRLAYRDASWHVISLDADTETRLAAPVDVHGDGCLIGQALYLLDGELIRADLGADPPILERHALTPPSPVLRLARTCGRHGEDLVFFAVETSTDRRPRSHVVVVGRDGAVRSRIELGVDTEPLTIGGEPDHRAAAYYPLRGELSDFVPVLLSRDDAFSLVVLDLVQGSIAWESAASHELLHYQVVRGRGGLLYLSHLGHVVAIDGTNGHVLAATRTSLEGIRGSYATEQRLWGYSMEWTSFPALPWVAADSRTLVRLAGANRELPAAENDLARTLEWLAVPAAFRP